MAPLYASGALAASGGFPPGLPEGETGRGRAAWDRGLRFYARNPRYPQADSAWSDSHLVTASVRGHDDRPATVESLPGHSPSEAGLSVPPGGEAHQAKAGRLTKPPPCGCCGLALERMRKRQASSSARVPANLRVGRGRKKAGKPDFGPEHRPAESEARAGAPPPAEGGLRLIVRRAGPGFAARELRNGGTGTSVHGPPGRPEASAEGSCRSGAGLRPGAAKAGAGIRKDFGSAERRTAGASAPTGSPQGNPKGASRLHDGPRRIGPRAPGSTGSRNRPARTSLASQAWCPPRRDSGGWRRRQPPFFLARDAPPSLSSAAIPVQPARRRKRSRREPDIARRAAAGRLEPVGR